MAHLVRALCCTLKDSRLDSWSSTYLGCGFNCHQGVYRRQPINVFLSHQCFWLSPPLSLKFCTYPDQRSNPQPFGVRNNTLTNWSTQLGLIYFLKNNHLFLERGRQGKERKRNINVWLPPMWPPLETWSTTQARPLTGNQTGDPLVSHSIHWACQPGHNLLLFFWIFFSPPSLAYILHIIVQSNKYHFNITDIMYFKRNNSCQNENVLYMNDI